MLWHYIGLLYALAATLWLRPAALSAYIVAPSTPPAGASLRQAATLATGCHHNGTWYADKSLIPTVEKCLNCQCQRKTLVCRLKVCPEMPLPPPRGCVVVQQRNSCCPYLSCARLEAFYKLPITRRIIQYLDHYERESIDRVVNENVLQRRSDDSNDVELHVCVKNGTVYKSGSAMSSSNLCSYCYCIGGAEKCVKPKCMLPVDGCKPIFVDSTCCPVRYDCSAKASGKSSQEVRYRKNSNKHFQRMSQRLQRNRGCNTAEQFYAEGQKMKSDADRPCDICFCIRGQRRCAPKKCAPALKNCIPVVPKGQCCPSSYDCGSQRDYRRAQSSRQFNLYSLLFGKEPTATSEGAVGEAEATAQYPHDRRPPQETEPTGPTTTASGDGAEKSIFDTLREGLEFIDGNNDKLLEQNLDLLPVESALKPVAVLPPPSMAPSTATEMSFLDMLLGPSTDALQAEAVQKPTTGAYGEPSWVDILLGEDEEYNKGLALASTIADRLDAGSAVGQTGGATGIDRIDEDFVASSGSGEISLLDDQYAYATTTTLMPTTTTRAATTTTKVPPTTTQKSTRVRPAANKPVFRPLASSNSLHKFSTTARPASKNATAATAAVPQPTTTENAEQPGFLSAFLDGFSSVLSAETQQTSDNEMKLAANSTTATTKHTTTTRQPATSSTTTTTRTTTTAATTKPPASTAEQRPPQFRPLPTTVKTHTRINSKIANLTNQATLLLTTKPARNGSTFRPQPTVKPQPAASATRRPRPPVSSTATAQRTTTTTTTTTSTTTTTPATTTTTRRIATTTHPIGTSSSRTTAKLPSITSTAEPLMIKTNPTILEAEPLDSSAEPPTLPPSLPNLKIIPFLPTDAVKKQTATVATLPALYADYYQSGGATGAGDSAVAVAVDSTAPHIATSRIDYDLYEEGNLYPAITERFPTGGDASKAAYSYKFNVEGPGAADASAGSAAGQALPAVPPNAGAFVKYDFVGDVAEVKLGVPAASATPSPPSMTGFSPPTKTEGGFVPKQTYVIGANGELHEPSDGQTVNYQVTQHIIDITSAEPLPEYSTRIIEFTTPDPFRDVLRTETPPDLTSLIEDKAKRNNNNKKAASNIISGTFNETNLQQQRPGSLASSAVPPFKTLPADEDAQSAEANGTATTQTSTVTRTTTTAIRKPAITTPAPTTTTTRARTTTKQKITKVRPTATAAPSNEPINNNNNNNSSATATKAVTNPKVSNNPATTHKPSSTQTASNRTATTTTTTTTPTTTTTTTTTTAHPFLQSPFDKLPFMDASFEVRPQPLAGTNGSPTPVARPSAAQQANSYLNLLHYKNSLHQYEGLEPIYETPTTAPPAPPATITTTTTVAPRVHSHYQLGASIGGGGGSGGVAATNSLVDAAGMLKLAGCNIYGRMYRVGRIILELSSACLECKCTEVGVKCGALDC